MSTQNTADTDQPAGDTRYDIVVRSGSVVFETTQYAKSKRKACRKALKIYNSFDSSNDGFYIYKVNGKVQ
jgi:hypothetical protein